MLYAIGAVIAAYLLGSISFAVIFGKLFTKKDVRNYGSGNAGMTNVMRVAGVVPGLLTFVCDTLKSVAACYIGHLLFSYGFNPEIAVYGMWGCGLVCQLGHVFPIYFKFKGGKGVATGLGVLIYCCPLAAATCLVGFLIMFLSTRIISLSSITAVVVALVTAFIEFKVPANDLVLFLLILSVGSLIIIKHKENIVRLIKGEEKKLKVKKVKS